MIGRSDQTELLRQFVDALRETLGLAPLYASDLSYGGVVTVSEGLVAFGGLEAQDDEDEPRAGPGPGAPAKKRGWALQRANEVGVRRANAQRRLRAAGLA